MTTYNKTTLKTFFEQGDVPSGTNYADLIDSQVNLVETALQTMAGPLATTELITARLSASNIVLGGDTFVVQVNTSAELAANMVVVSGRTGLVLNGAGGSGVRIAASAGGIFNQSSTTYTVSAGGAMTLNAVGAIFIDSTGGALNLTAQSQIVVSSNGNININSPAGNNISLNSLNGVNLNAALGSVTVSAGVNVDFRESPVIYGVLIVSAAGTAQATAAVCSAVVNRGKGVVDGQTTGFRPRANKAGLIQYLFNEGASANLWPPVGGTINGLAVNAPFPLATSAMVTIVHLTASAMAVK